MPGGGWSGWPLRCSRPAWSSRGGPAVRPPGRSSRSTPWVTTSTTTCAPVLLPCRSAGGRHHGHPSRALGGAGPASAFRVGAMLRLRWCHRLGATSGASATPQVDIRLVLAVPARRLEPVLDRGAADGARRQRLGPGLLRHPSHSVSGAARAGRTPCRRPGPGRDAVPAFVEELQRSSRLRLELTPPRHEEAGGLPEEPARFFTTTRPGRRRAGFRTGARRGGQASQSSHACTGALISWVELVVKVRIKLTAVGRAELIHGRGALAHRHLDGVDESNRNQRRAARAPSLAGDTCDRDGLALTVRAVI